MGRVFRKDCILLGFLRDFRIFSSDEEKSENRDLFLDD